LLTYKSTIILSVRFKGALVANAFTFISTGVVLLITQPISTSEDVNNVVFVPPVEYLETT
jgi:hypothetical protein